MEKRSLMLAGGGPGEFGRRIIVRELRSEVDLHYLFNFRKLRFAQAVDLGVRAARAWCDENCEALSQVDPKRRRT